MNKERRNRLIEISKKMLDLMVDLNKVKEEAQDKYYNTIVELAAEETLRSMSNTLDALRYSIASLEDSKDYLQGAIEE